MFSADDQTGQVQLKKESTKGSIKGSFSKRTVVDRVSDLKIKQMYTGSEEKQQYVCFLGESRHKVQ